MSQEKLRVGILGCGPIAQFAHLESVQKARNASLYAICDVADDLVNRLAAYYQPEKVFLDFEEMLADPKLDAVIIATSDAWHIPLARMALNADKHVLVEKPLSPSLDEALELNKLLDNSKLVLQVAHMKRFDPGIEFAHEFIRDEMGEMLALKAWYCDSTHRYTVTDAVQPLPIKSEKKRKPAGDPKADKRTYYMLAHGSHLLDTAFWLGGEIKSVKASLVEKFGAYSWFIDTQFENGANGHLDLSIAVRMDWHEGFHIYGEYGSVIGKVFNPWYYKSSEVECFSEKEGTYKRALGADGHFYRRQIEGFVDTIIGIKAQQGCNFQEGIHSIRAMIAIAHSVNTGQRVWLDTVTGSLDDYKLV